MVHYLSIITGLSTKLVEFAAKGKRIQVGPIGAGKFGSVLISQSYRIAGLRLAGIANVSQGSCSCLLQKDRVPEEKCDATCIVLIVEGIEAVKTTITNDSAALIATTGIDNILEATGNLAAGICHTLSCREHKKNIVMVNLEADVLVGLLLGRKAREAGIINSMAYGGRTALITEMVEWASTAGLTLCTQARAQSICLNITTRRRILYGTTTGSPSSNMHLKTSMLKCSTRSSMVRSQR